jgi:hypothetical protein
MAGPFARAGHFFVHFPSCVMQVMHVGIRLSWIVLRCSITKYQYKTTRNQLGRSKYMTLFQNFQIAMQKRAAYSRLKHELRSMPRHTAIDLGLFPEDAAKTAARAIYG